MVADRARAPLSITESVIERMKAIVRDEYGSADVLHQREVPTPVPGADEVLIRVCAVSINGSDREALAGRPLYARMDGVRRPRHHILGSDIAGRVERVGANVRDFQPGDEVFGELPGYHGGFAEYACAPQRMLLRKPATLTFAEAAAIPQGGGIAYQAICIKGDVKRGQKVLINGAGGAAGTFAVQLAKLRAAEVTAVDSAEKADLLHSLGADHVIDYAVDDFTTTGERYDLILDVIAQRLVTDYARALLRNGTCFVVGGSVGVLLQSLLLGPVIRMATGKRVRVLVVPQDRANVSAITELCKTRHVVPIIDRLYPFAELADAMRYVAAGRHKGKVVIIVDDTNA